MGSREEYTSCMRPYMTGGGPDRKDRFCKGSKICSGKASTEEEAARLCAEAAANPKPPKEKKGRKVCTLRDLEAIATCVSAEIDLSSLTPENMHKTFSSALKKCSAGAAESLKTAKKTLTDLDPKHIQALETIALMSKQSEGRQW